MYSFYTIIFTCVVFSTYIFFIFSSIDSSIIRTLHNIDSLCGEGVTFLPIDNCPNLCDKRWTCVWVRVMVCVELFSLTLILCEAILLQPWMDIMKAINHVAYKFQLAPTKQMKTKNTMMLKICEACGSHSSTSLFSQRCFSLFALYSIHLQRPATINLCVKSISHILIFLLHAQSGDKLCFLLSTFFNLLLRLFISHAYENKIHWKTLPIQMMYENQIPHVHTIKYHYIFQCACGSELFISYFSQRLIYLPCSPHSHRQKVEYVFLLFRSNV